jgi:hypothetical protein
MLQLCFHNNLLYHITYSITFSLEMSDEHSILLTLLMKQFMLHGHVMRIDEDNGGGADSFF